MRLEPFALSIHHFITSVGADAGFASIIGLAILVLLYFAQARETASLRDQAELAAQKIAQLENRLAHTVTAQPQPQAQPAIAVAPMPAHRLGSSFPAAVPHPAPAIIAAANPSPPAGVAAPPLSAATKLIPTPPVQPPAIGAPGVAAARIGAPAAASARAPVPATPAAGGAGSPIPAAAGAAAPVPAAAAASAAPGTLSPGSPPPVNRIVTPRPATAAGGATATNGTGEHPPVAPPIPVPLAPPVPPRATVNRPPLVGGLGDDPGDSGHSNLARVLTAVAAIAVLAAIVVVLVSLTQNSPSPRTTSQALAPVSNAPKPATHHSTTAKKPPAVNDASVTVAVLNGTAVYHLANSVATKLSGLGFKEGTVADAANQQESATTVQYVSGDQRDATAVARALKLPDSSVQPITPDTQALGCPQAGSCSVVVTVGSDLASAQTQTTP